MNPLSYSISKRTFFSRLEHLRSLGGSTPVQPIDWGEPLDIKSNLVSFWIRYHSTWYDSRSLFYGGYEIPDIYNIVGYCGGCYGSTTFNNSEKHLTHRVVFYRNATLRYQFRVCGHFDSLPTVVPRPL